MRIPKVSITVLKVGTVTPFALHEWSKTKGLSAGLGVEWGLNLKKRSATKVTVDQRGEEPP
jgi:hypothetical protein